MTGRLLVATPALVDPNFARAVVFLLAHGDEGAFGVVLNRPLDSTPVLDHLPRWSEHVAAPAVLFAGGPVEPAAAIGLACADGEPPASAWTAVIPGLGIVDLESSPDEMGDGLRRVRVFTGYAGWGAGQLEHEIQQEAWFVVAPTIDDLFSDSPHELWRQVLRRQPGKLAMFAYYPEQPGTN